MSTIISFLRKMNKLRLRRNAGIGFISSRAFVLRPYEVLTPWLICSFALGCQLFIIRAWWIRKILVNWKSYSTCFLDYFLIFPNGGWAHFVHNISIWDRVDRVIWADIGRQMVLCIVFIYSKERISVDSPVSMSLWNVEASHLGESLKNISFTNSSLLSFSLTTFGENWAVQGLGCWQVLGCRCFLLLLKDIRITLVLRWAEGECGILMWRLKNLRS